MRASITGQAFGRFDNDPTSTTNLLIRDLTFSNSSTTHKVWREGTGYTGTITVPYGYSKPTWLLVNHDTGTLAAVGSGTSVSYPTPIFAGTDKCPTYDLLVSTVRAGYPRVTRVFYGEATILPAVPAVFDETWDLGAGSVIKDGGGTDRGATGYKIKVIGTSSSTNVFTMFGWVSSNPLKPIHVVFEGAVINSSNNSVPRCKLSGNQNLIIDGCYSEGTQYGLTVNNTGATINGTENVYIEANGGDKNFIVCGIHVDNGAHTKGGTGFVIQMFNGTTNNDNVYRFNRGTVFNVLLENCKNEGFYVGHTTDTALPPFGKLTNWNYYRCNTNHTDNEGFQMGGHIGADVFNCNWLDAGLSGVDGQRNIFVVRPGCRNVSIYSNYGWGNYDLTFLEPSITGQDVNIFANTFETINVAFVQGILFRLAQSVLYSTLNYNIFNNLLRVSTGPPFQLYNDVGGPPTTVCKMYGDGNILLTDTTTNSQTYNSYNTGNTILNNKTFINIDDALFFNAGTKDYRPATLDSTALNFSRNSTAVAIRKHRYSNCDKDGYVYDPTNAAAGPYSCIQLMNGIILTKDISSIAGQTPVSVPFGTSWATALTFLPTKVLTTFNDTSNRKLTVTWSQGSYNGNTPATYSISGTVTNPSDVTNTGAITVAINVTVQSSLSPVSIKVNLFTGTAAGWIPTGSTSPWPGSLSTVDFGQLGTTGIGIRALNTTNKSWSGTGASGGTGATYPNAVHQTYWYTQATSGADFELYETTAGSLSGRLYTIKILASRASLASARWVRITAASGQTADINAAPTSAGNDILITLTHVTAPSGVIRITILGITPNDGVPPYGMLNGMEVDSE